MPAIAARSAPIRPALVLCAIAAASCAEPVTPNPAPAPRSHAASDPPPPASDPPGVADDEQVAAQAPLPSASPQPPSPPAIPPKTTVLHVGDSFVHSGFTQALRPRLRALGARYEVRAKESSYTITWAPRMAQLIAETNPDLVIVTLGANEVTNIAPAAHAPAVRRIVKAIDGRPCVWVSPPMWRKDTGILDVIRENSAPCRYFDSDAHVREPIAKRADKIHPSAEGGAVWAAAFWAWLEAERAPADPTHPGQPWALRPAPEAEHRARALLAHGDADD